MIKLEHIPTLFWYILATMRGFYLIKRAPRLTVGHWLKPKLKYEGPNAWRYAATSLAFLL